jgi:hypothetical protein
MHLMTSATRNGNLFRRSRPGEKLPTNIGVPADLELTSRGEALYVLMELNQLSTDELRPLAEALWEFTGSPAPWRPDKQKSG